MPGPRTTVPSPTTAPAPYGLLSVVQARYNEPDPHWRNGVNYQPLCGVGNSGGGGFTYDDACVTGAPTKAATASLVTRGATPFAAYAEVDCSPVGGFWDDAEARAADALTRSEAWQVERAFWTGSATNGYVVYPHLAANAVVNDSALSSTVLLQSAATTVTGVALDPAEGLGRLEQALADCYDQQGVIHIPAGLIPSFDARGLIKASGQQLKTLNGNLVAAGNGYPGTAPDGTSTTGVLWIYATGQVFAYRSEQIRFRREDSFDRSENTLKQIAERVYVLGWDCCHFAIPITLGGNVAGTFNSAT